MGLLSRFVRVGNITATAHTETLLRQRRLSAVPVVSAHTLRPSMHGCGINTRVRLVPRAEPAASPQLLQQKASQRARAARFPFIALTMTVTLAQVWPAPRGTAGPALRG